MGEVIDFAVIGGGVAGTYVAWRLATAPGARTVHLFEATSRVGGRLLTSPMPELPFRVELGGMRYTDRQLLLAKLVKVLNLGCRPFEFETCLLFLRGCHLVPTAAPPYKLGMGEIGKSPGELILHAIRCALREVILGHGNKADLEPIKKQLATLFNPLSPLNVSILTQAQWSLLKRYGELHSAPLYEIGFWNLLQYYLSSEGFLYAHDGLGYESILANWNAAEAIPWFLRDFDVHYRTLERGMEAVPAALDFEFVKTCPDCRHFRHTLTSIEQRIDGAEKEYRLAFTTAAGTEEVAAKNVILALPKAPLKNIQVSRFGPASPRRLGEILVELGSVTGQPLFKLFLGYRKAWWTDPRGLARPSGRACTDLPIRQVYYFAVISADIDSPNGGGGVLMASYNDAHYVDFWKPLHRRGVKPFYYDGDVGSLPDGARYLLEAYGASEKMVKKAQRQIRLLHPELSDTDSIPDPYVGLVMEWSDQPPYYYGWHTWNVHANPWQVMHRLKRPFRESNVFICGEAYSCEQGWVEGALRSGELVLKELGFDPPGWLDPPEYRSEGFQDYDEYIGC